MTYKYSNQQAFSLLELMIVIAMIGIIISLAYPAILSSLQAMESKRVENELRQLLRQARSETYILKADTTLCTIDNSGQCNRLGQDGLLLFIDTNKNTLLDNDERIIYRRSLNLRHGSIVVNASAHRNHIRYQGNTGKPTGHFGHILYCSPSKNKRLSFKLILNAHGHVRIEHQDLTNINCHTP